MSLCLSSLRRRRWGGSAPTRAPSRTVSEAEGGGSGGCCGPGWGRGGWCCATEPTEGASSWDRRSWWLVQPGCSESLESSLELLSAPYQGQETGRGPTLTPGGGCRTSCARPNMVAPLGPRSAAGRWPWVWTPVLCASPVISQHAGVQCWGLRRAQSRGGRGRGLPSQDAALVSVRGRAPRVPWRGRQEGRRGGEERGGFPGGGGGRTAGGVGRVAEGQAPPVPGGLLQS